MKRLRISGIENDSIVDGPGLRLTVFTQGCPHHCPGCHNPQTHSFKGGKKVWVSKVIKEIAESPLIYGVTFSGGEPFMQAKTLIPIARFVKAQGLEMACYTGFLFEELLADKVPFARELLNYIDILIDGKFVLSQKSMDLKYKGSKNQRTIDVQKSLEAGRPIITTDKKWN